MTDGIRVKPTIEFLFDLVDKVVSGTIRVPDFQRRYIWSEGQMTDLFDSVVKSYPIGSLFFWSTESDHATSQRVGPVEQPERKPGTSMQLILDGQQRLTTLVGALKAEGTASRAWMMYYDPELKRFCHAKTDNTIERHWVQVSSLTKTLKILRACKRLIEIDGKKAPEWIEQIESVARALAGYKIPIIEYVDNNLSSAVEVFSRLNQKGSRIAADELVSALTYREDLLGASTFRLADHISDLLKLIETTGFGPIDRTFILRAILASAEMDIYRTNWTSLSKELREQGQQRLPAAAKEIRRGLRKALKFLRSIGVHNHRMLPYGMQLVTLSVFFGRCAKPSESQLKLLSRWFWVSSFSAWFGSSNPSQERWLIEEFRDKVAKDKNAATLETFDVQTPALPMPKRLDQRSARARALINVMLAQEPRTRTGKPLGINAAALLVSKDAAAIGHIFSSRLDGLRASPANRILAVQSKPGLAKKWLSTLKPAYRDEVLLSHAIPPGAAAALAAGDADAFLHLRLAHLDKLERAFMKQNEVTPPKEGASPVDSPIDTDG